MSDIIRLLPDYVANQIAAGEVIQRPANVIKELVENSVDAGAKTINVLSVDAGRTLIQVIDDGKGMSETDARLAFERHATSKIRSAEDLFALRTMGFRGEALPSISAVSQMEVTTRQESDELGVTLEVQNSKVLSHKQCACSVGCNIKVQNIFYNVPGRRKFLKTNKTELNNMLDAFQKIALVYPEIEFTFHSNGDELYNLKSGNAHKRILDIFPKLKNDLLAIESDTHICKITGFVGRPESARKNCAQQYFFVNGRFMRHPYFASAVQSAMERLVPTGEKVPYFIYFDIDPSEIDVNVSPTKTEIKFEDEQHIWQLLASAVRDAIGVFSGASTLDFDVEGRPDIPMFNGDAISSVPHATSNPTYNPFKQGNNSTKPSVQGWEGLYQSAKQEETLPGDDIFSSLNNGNDPSPLDDKSVSHFQYKGQYIVTSVKSGLMLIDQHRAHICVLYEQYIRQMKEAKPTSQKMLFPEAVQFDACDAVFLDTVVDEMTEMGFELTPLGAGNYAIGAVPAGLEGINPSALVQDMVADVINAGSKIKDEINHTLALSLARQAAIPYGQVLGNAEMEDLVNRLFACENINYTPDGKNVFSIIKQSEIEQMFA